LIVLKKKGGGVSGRVYNFFVRLKKRHTQKNNKRKKGSTKRINIIPPITRRRRDKDKETKKKRGTIELTLSLQTLVGGLASKVSTAPRRPRNTKEP